jgi:MoaA/NifB/PqqE/SkfB family radical SAM enzyme
MPSTIGLRQWNIASRPDRLWLPVSELATGAGGLNLPPELLAQAGLSVGDELLAEVGPHGLRLTADRLRKVYVEITSTCNLACATCIRRAWDEPLGHMPLTRFRRLIEGLSEVRESISTTPVTLSLSGFGEPLMHPEFLTLVQLARERGLSVELITNGTLLDAKLAASLAELGLAQVAVSLDAGDEEVYGRIRGGAWGSIVDAVKALAEARRRARTPMAVGAAFVATLRNVRSLPRLMQLARDLDLDFVWLSNVVPHTAEMAAEMLWGHTAWVVSFPPTGWRPRLITAPFDLNEAIGPALSSLWELGPVLPPPGLDGLWQRNYCRFAHEGMLAVRWDGCVAPCLSLLHTHPEYVNGHWKMVQSYIVGHVDEQSLADIWREPAYRTLRQRLRNFDFPACFACGGCPDAESNELDCYGNPLPACGECLWAQGIVLCP